jgi:hypothetical protein
MRNIEIDEAKPAKTIRRKRIDAWISALSFAEAAAKQVVQGGEKLSPRYFLINCRIGIEPSANKGTDAQRRSALIEIIESMRPVEKHLSTSTWLVRLHIQTATQVRDFLTGPLDVELDGLHVTHSSRDNRAAFGTTDLQS